jgi:hypothetical protein
VCQDQKVRIAVVSSAEDYINFYDPVTAAQFTQVADDLEEGDIRTLDSSMISKGAGGVSWGAWLLSSDISYRWNASVCSVHEISFCVAAHDVIF